MKGFRGKGERIGGTWRKPLNLYIMAQYSPGPKV